MKQKILKAINESNSMAEAARLLGMPFTTFKRMTQKLQAYKPNPNPPGIAKGGLKYIPLKEVLSDNLPRRSLKRKLLREGILKNECSLCGNKGMHNDKALTMVLDHINGISNDNRLENLRMVCPNCNSQLSTFAGRNVKK